MLKNQVQRLLVTNDETQDLINPTILEFNNQTDFKMKLSSDQHWNRLTCEDIEAVLYTLLEWVPL